MHRPSHPSPRLPVLAVAVAVAVALGVLAGCGIDEGVVAREARGSAPTTSGETANTTTTASPRHEAGPSSPFAVDAVPDGYDLLVAGTGEAEPGDDDEPVTVLAPDGEPTGPGVVFVEAVLAGEDAPADEDGDADADFQVGAAGRWAALTTTDGLRVWGVDGAEDDLQAVADTATPSPVPGGAPVVEDPPPGLEVVGSIAVDGVLGLLPVVPGGPDDPVPGPASAHVAVWTSSDSSLVVMTLPGGSLDPAAVVTEARPPRRTVDGERDAVAEEVEVGDATGVVTTTARSNTGAVIRRELAVTTADGDVLLVVSRGGDILDADALVALAESVTPTDDETWDTFTATAGD